jgi:Na+/H+ antiporter NhaC
MIWNWSDFVIGIFFGIISVLTLFIIFSVWVKLSNPKKSSRTRSKSR